uniref:BTB domain-containing protein n=1 Tax=Panagrolaimus superbus TaxID=310955 RepID=A0A914YJ95_9BILA
MDQQILYKFQMKRFEVFNAQDSENDHFDVIFEINGKKLYANTFMLCPISTTFKSMISDRWTKRDETIPIQDYTFDDFKEFLTFIYSGKCALTNENVFALIDMAEFYGVPEFKKACEKFSLNIIDTDNALKIHEYAFKYSMAQLKKSINIFIAKNLSNLINSEKLQTLQKFAVKDIIVSINKISKQEELFEMVNI